MPKKEGQSPRPTFLAQKQVLPADLGSLKWAAHSAKGSFCATVLPPPHPHSQGSPQIGNSSVGFHLSCSQPKSSQARRGHRLCLVSKDSRLEEGLLPSSVQHPSFLGDSPLACFSLRTILLGLLTGQLPLPGQGEHMAPAGLMLGPQALGLRGQSQSLLWLDRMQMVVSAPRLQLLSFLSVAFLCLLGHSELPVYHQQVPCHLFLRLCGLSLSVPTSVMRHLTSVQRTLLSWLVSQEGMVDHLAMPILGEAVDGMTQIKVGWPSSPPPSSSRVLPVLPGGQEGTGDPCPAF